MKLSGIAALVCAKGGEIYFQPGGNDKVADAANSLFRLAQTGKQHKHGQPKYAVRNGKMHDRGNTKQ